MKNSIDGLYLFDYISFFQDIRMLFKNVSFQFSQTVYDIESFITYDCNFTYFQKLVLKAAATN